MPETSPEPSSMTAVLCISGHDPSGGAGIQADIETVNACGAHALSVPSCLTVQNHRSVQAVHTVDSHILRDSIDCLLESMHPAGVKIGLLGHARQAAVISDCLASMPDDIPVVLDPVIRASDGSQLSHDTLVQAIREELLPRTTVLTPNHYEARQLTACEDMNQALQKILETGCYSVLLTGGDEQDTHVCNALYQQKGLIQQWQHPRQPGSFHGSGCTLAAAMASFLALGNNILEACTQAQQFTQQAIMHALTVDDGPRIPLRRSP